MRLNNELKEIKADKQPIGLHRKISPFNQLEIDIQSGDQIYLFSDGYPDQLNADNQRFKLAQLKKSLESFAHLPLAEQFTSLFDQHVQWKGDAEQIDDILILGVKL